MGRIEVKFRNLTGAWVTLRRKTGVVWEGDVAEPVPPTQGSQVVSRRLDKLRTNARIAVIVEGRYTSFIDKSSLSHGAVITLEWSDDHRRTVLVVSS